MRILGLFVAGDGFAALTLMMFVAGMVFYFLPCIVAGSRKVNSGAGIVLLNLFLGWTVVGWIAALIWACTAETKGAAAQREMAVQYMAHQMSQATPPQPATAAQVDSATLNAGRAVGGLFRREKPVSLFGDKD